MRLFRIGKINQPSFKLVVTDKRNPSRGGRFVEQVGTYNPVTKEKNLDKERAKYWLSKGVQPSPTVYNMLLKEGVCQGKKLPKHKKSKKPLPAEASAKAGAEAPVPAAPATVPEVPVAEEAPKEEVKKEESTPKGP